MRCVFFTFKLSVFCLVLIFCSLSSIFGQNNFKSDTIKTHYGEFISVIGKNNHFQDLESLELPIRKGKKMDFLNNSLSANKYNSNSEVSSLPGFTKYYGGVVGYESIGLSFVQQPTGDFLIAGGRLANIDGFVIKTKSNGDFNWAKQLHSVNFSQIINTSDGNYAVVSAEISPSPNEWRPLLIKMDQNANVLWSKKYQFLNGVNGISPNFYRTDRSGLIQTSDNGFAITCIKSDTSKGTLVMNTTTLNFALTHVNLIKTDFAGNMQWYKNYMFNFSNPLHQDLMDPDGFVQTPDGGYLIVGASSAQSNFTKGFIVKTDNLGNIQWSNLYVPDGALNSQSYFRSIHLLTNGDYIISGESIDPSNPSSPCVFAISINSSGTILWSKKYFPGNVGGFYYYGNNIIESAGSLFLLGSFTYTTAANYRPFIAKLDMLGNIIWTKAYGDWSVQGHQSNIIRQDASGNLGFVGIDLATDKTTFVNVDPISGATSGCFYSDSTLTNLAVTISPTVIPTPIITRSGVTDMTVTKTTVGVCNSQCGLIFPQFSLTPSSGSICSGQSATLNATGEAASYSWSPSVGLSSSTGSVVVATPSTSIIYTVTGYDYGGMGCVTNTIEILVNPVPTLTLGISSRFPCSGESVTLSVSGASTYTWTNPVTTGSINVVTPSSTTTYSVIGTSSNNCNSITNTVTVNVTPTPTISITATNTTLCSGSSATLSAFGATSYTWTNPVVTTSTNIVAPLSTTIYTIVGQNSVIGQVFSCFSSNTIAINVNPTPTLNLSLANSVICSGNSATLSANGAFTYTWTNPVTTGSTSVVTPSSTTIYTVIGTSSNNCISIPNTITVNVTPTPTISVTATNTTLCSGNSATLSAFGATSYTWTNPVVTTSTNIVTPLSTTIYTIVGQNSVIGQFFSCFSSNTIAINVNPTPTLNLSAVNPVICSGNSATISANGAFTYTWTNPLTTGSTIIVSPTSTIIYTVVGTSSNNCISVSETVTVNVNSTPTISVVSTNTTICSGNTATLSVNGALTYTWTNPFTTGSTNIISPLSTTVYTVIGNSADNCYSTPRTITISVNPTPTLTLGVTNITICSGNSATLSANGASTYTWTSPVTNGNTNVVNPLITTIYTVTGTSLNNCISPVNVVTVNVNPTPTITGSITNVTCFGLNNASISINTSGGTAPYTLTPTTTVNLAPGNYTYTVNDVNFCNTSAIFTITQPSAALTASSAVTSSNTSCLLPNGNASVTIQGGTPSYTINWSNGSTNNPVTNLNTGLSTYTVIDINGCLSSSGSVTVPGVSGILTTIVSQSSVNCFGGINGSATFSTSGAGPFSYTMASGTNTLTNSTGTFTGLSFGQYTLNVLGAGSCTDTKLLTIAQPSFALTINAITINSVSCFWGVGSVSVNPLGGTGGYTYQWQSNPSIVNTATYVAGSYSINVSDANGCSVTQTFNINQPNASLLVNSVITSSNTSCILPNGTASVSISGGTPNYTVNWSTGSTNNPVTNLNTGLTTYTVTDANGCSTASGSVSLSGVVGILTSIVSQSNVNCFGGTSGSATFSTSGVGPFNYTIASTTNTFTNSSGLFTGLPVGQYSLITTGAGGCADTKSLVISQPSSALTINSLITPSISCFGATTVASVNPVGGTPAYIYQWQSNSSTTNTANYSAGTYSVTILDLNGCSITQTFTINQPNSSLSVISTTSSNVNCLTPNGQAALNVSSGTPGYSYLWSNGATNNTIAGLNGGVYTYTVTDFNNCTQQGSVSIVDVTQTPTISSVIITSISCAGNSTGSAAINVNGGTAPYSYIWTGSASTSSNITNVSAGNFTVVVTDAQACKTSTSITVTDALPLSISTLSVNSPCVDEKTGSATIVITGGTPNYTVTWSPSGSISSGSLATIQNVSVGNYSGIIIDNNGCTSTHVLTISQNSSLDACSTFFVPGGFSPNGDGVNETFMIKGLSNYPNNEFTVLNRWGNIVYKVKGYDNSWNGKAQEGFRFGGDDLPEGTYFCIFDFGNDQKPYKGIIYLNRTIK